jgi:PAS domain S-box-containing protein
MSLLYNGFRVKLTAERRQSGRSADDKGAEHVSPQINSWQRRLRIARNTAGQRFFPTAEAKLNGRDPKKDLRRLKLRMALLFAAAAAVIIAGGLAYHRHYRAALLKDASALLASVQRFKADQLNYWRGERLNDTLSLLESPIFSTYVNRLADEPGDPVLKKTLKDRLAKYIERNKYSAAFLARPDGSVVVAAGGLREICPEDKALIKRAAAAGRPELGDFYITPGQRRPHIDLAAPATRRPGGKQLFLVLRIEPQDYLYPLLKTWPTNSPTAETLLVRKDGDSVLYLNDLRHRPDAAMKLRLPLEGALPAARAAKGETGVLQGRDYRGKEVLAVVSAIPGSSWFLVSKMDLDEISEDADAVSALLLALVALMLAAAGGGSFLLFRRQAEEYSKHLYETTAALGHSEDKFRIFFENSPLGKSITGLDGSLQVNKAFCAMLGYSERELRGKKWQELTPAEEISGIEALLKPLFTGERTSMQFETRFIRKDGVIINAEVTTALQRDAAGKPEYLITTVNDITARKQAENELADTNKKLKTLINSMPDIVCFKDGKGRWLEANTFDLELFQLEKVDYKGKKDSELAPFSPFYHDAFMACESSDELAWSKKDLSRGEEIIPSPSGKNFIFDIIKVPLFNPDGSRLGLIVVGRDITERKAAENALKKLNQDLAEKTQEMENFLYITTHDLRSPLVNIQGFSQNLERYIEELRQTLAGAALPPETAAALKKLTGDSIPVALSFVLASSQKMDALISALLKVSRLGRVEMKPAVVDMNGLLKTVLAGLRYQLEAAGGQVNCAALPPCLADPGAASQLFTNLLDNAIKYRAEGRALVVTVTGEIKNGRAVYTVADNGRGIAAKELPDIWKIFYRAHNAQTKLGEGIGLPMVRRIAEKNGGGIRAESKEGAGTAFYVELPAAKGEK